MKLSSMTEEEYKRWAPRSRQSYAQDKMKANGLTLGEAEKIAEQDFLRILPEGLNSKDNFLFTAKNEEDTILGFVWYCLRGMEDNRRAFICDILVVEQFRGQGYGRQMMEQVEQEARKQGLKRVGLHVFGFNAAAIKLYQSLGYLTTDLVMEKSLEG
jgi:ribosomal protein S18 acetylase RimI-like enzyme